MQTAINPTAIDRFESAAAAHLENSLPAANVRLWADAFSTNGETRSKSQIYFGARNWTYSNRAYNPATDRYEYTQTYTLDVQAIVFTLHNHSDALNLIGAAMKALSDYQPFVEFSPIIPVRAGDARFDKANGSWLYSGELSVSFYGSDDAPLTPIAPIAEPVIVRVGLYNISAAADLQLDREYI